MININDKLYEIYEGHCCQFYKVVNRHAPRGWVALFLDISAPKIEASGILYPRNYTEVLISDLHKRRENLEQQDIEPSETDKAISEARKLVPGF